MPTTCSPGQLCRTLEPQVTISPVNVAVQTDPNPHCVDLTMTITWNGPGTITGGAFTLALGWWAPAPNNHLVLSSPFYSDPISMAVTVGPGQTVRRPVHECFTIPGYHWQPGQYLVAENIAFTAHE